MKFVVVADEVRTYRQGPDKTREYRYLFVRADGQEYRVPLRLGLPVTFKEGSEIIFECPMPAQRALHVLDLHPQQVEVGGHVIVLTKRRSGAHPAPQAQVPLATTSFPAEVGGSSSVYKDGEKESVQSVGLGEKPLALKLNDIRSLHRKLLEFVAWIGEKNIGVFGTEKLDSAAKSLSDFEWDFANLRDQCLRRKWKCCVWAAERQPQTRLWHIHAFVDMGFDFQSGFPFEKVSAGDYRDVDRKVLRLWQYLREGAALWKYGRMDLKPIRATVERAASYISGRALFNKSAKFKRLPEGCGSWGLRDQGAAVSDAPDRLPRHATLHAPDGITEPQEITDAKCPPDSPYFMGQASQERLRMKPGPGLTDAQLREKFKGDEYEDWLREKGQGWSP
jgi:hypothetical protein